MKSTARKWRGTELSEEDGEATQWSSSNQAISWWGRWGDGGMGHGMGGWGVVSSRAWSPQWKYVNDCK